MPVIGLMTATENQLNFERWCINQLPLYKAVVCVDASNNISQEYAEKFENRLIRVRHRDSDRRDSIAVAHEEIVRRFGPGQWIMLCHANEYCYHDPAKIAALADRFESDAVGWYCPKYHLFPKNLRSLRPSVMHQDLDEQSQHGWCRANSGLPPIEYRLYRDSPDSPAKGASSSRRLSCDFMRKAPFHPILRCYNLADKANSFGERDLSSSNHDIFDEPWNLGEEFRPSAQSLCRIDSDKSNLPAVTREPSSSDESQAAQWMRDAGGGTGSQSAGVLETHPLRLRGNTIVKVPVVVRGLVDRSIIDEIWNRDAYGLRAMTDTTPATVIDVGAHIGIFSLFATELWPNARIVACEADPENFQLLSENTCGRARIEPVEAAVVDAEVTEIIFHAVTNKGALNSGGGSCARSEIGTRPIRVPAIAFAKLWRERNIGYCDLLKLDCEGSELPLLSSLSKAGLLHRVGRIVGEWHAEDSRIESVISVHRALEAILSHTHRVDFAEFGTRREGQFVAEPMAKSPSPPND